MRGYFGGIFVSLSLLFAVKATGETPPSPLIGVTIDDVTPVQEIIRSLSQITIKPTARVVFDFGRSPNSYKSALIKMKSAAYIMGQIADSSEMKNITPEAYRLRTQTFWRALQNEVDIWEVGNEVNGLWLGPHAFEKIRNAYEEISKKKSLTAVTFFYEGEPEDTVNCIEAPGSDMFSWIHKHFELDKKPSARSSQSEKMRLGLSYVFVSWYPDQCFEIKPRWKEVFIKLAQIFPNAKVGFGEIGPEKPQFGSEYEINLIREFYSMSKDPQFHENFVGGYFWWHFVSEMVPAEKTPLLKTLNEAISPSASNRAP
ncbi:hypothetical protein [Bdellovibrio sp. HCB2-146]|uniref:hypothetical protein n=1 Tax=Bdellovibrio sp. HCB2-146 TaxID=3394362 RepID=UPI0039BD3A96